jgi:methyl-accepting chemotaxis protein
MKKWTIKKRIVASFATILVLVAALTITSYILLRQAKDAAHFMTVDAMPGMDAMSQIKGLVGDCQIDVLRDLLAKTPEDHKKFRDAIAAGHDKRDKLRDDYEKSITTSEDRELFGKLKEAAAQYTTFRNQLLDLIDAGKMDEAMQFNVASVRPAFLKYDDLVDQELTLNLNNGNQETEQTVKATDHAMSFILGISVIVMIFGIVIATIITGGLNKVLRQLALSLDDGSQQVASAASQVSSSSQSLAEGASEQAASIEETSSSMEEMSSMTKRNAENAQKANDLAKQARSAADKGAGDMQTMNAAMEAIKVSSDDIAKIIKTIDEIAFQTNILALNAAVEAARAGEAGMGFAVVADEVRNLAQRSAKAAKETADKIEGAITKTAQGVGISKQVANALNDIVTQIRQVDELIAEVAGASKEQTQGITQINSAVGQMDKVTQGNAASAEECAAAAEELNAQAETMKQSVGELLQLVGGAENRSEHTGQIVPKAEKKPFLKITSAHNGNGNGHAAKNLSHERESAPALVAARRDEIPLDGDFKDF